MKVTKRWEKFTVIGYIMNDLIQVDFFYYLCVPQYIQDYEIISRLGDGKYKRYTLKDLREQRGSHPLLKMMYERADQETQICECGAGKVNTTHSDWCPKHE